MILILSMSLGVLGVSGLRLSRQKTRPPSASLTSQTPTPTRLEPALPPKESSPSPATTPSPEPSLLPGVEALSDQEAVENLARLEAPFVNDYVAAQVEGDWGFIDVARKDPQSGDWSESTSGLYRRQQGKWSLVTWGDPQYWEDYQRLMKPEEVKAFERWQSSHY